MTVEFNHDTVMKLFEKKRKMFLTQTGIMGANLAAINSRYDLGTSQSAKEYTWVHPDKLSTFKDDKDFSPRRPGNGSPDDERVYINAPMEYDIYLERRYGILAKTEDQLIPYMLKFEEEYF